MSLRCARRNARHVADLAGSAISLGRPTLRKVGEGWGTRKSGGASAADIALRGMKAAGASIGGLRMSGGSERAATDREFVTGRKAHRQECLCYQRRKAGGASAGIARRGKKAAGASIGGARMSGGSGRTAIDREFVIGRKAHRQECLCYQKRKTGGADYDIARLGGTASGPPPKGGGKTRATAEGAADRSATKDRREFVRGDGSRRLVLRGRSESSAEAKLASRAGEQTDRAAAMREGAHIERPAGAATADSAAACVCSIGATRVGGLFERVRLHLTTDRFLARLRDDALWAAACDFAVLDLAQRKLRLGRKVLAQWICATARAKRSAKVSEARHVEAERELRRRSRRCVATRRAAGLGERRAAMGGCR
jgi:hypothetical protein